MKNSKCKVFFKYLLLFLLAQSNINYLIAQNLPNVQKQSVRLPASYNIDGKATEWNDQYQAFNKATEIYYTLANDDKNLYLVVMAAKPSILSKIMRGGITVTINSSNKKDFKGSATITYPIVKPSDMRAIQREIYKADQPGDVNLSADAFLRRQDSTMAAVNRKLLFIIKEIGVSNLHGVTDSTLSIYNQYGMKAFLSIGNKNNLVYELQIPLELLGLSRNVKDIAYNIRLNGLQTDARQVPVNIVGAESGEHINVFKGAGQVSNDNLTPKMAEMVAMTSPTDFWGYYVLAER